MAHIQTIETASRGDATAARSAAWMQLAFGFIVMMTISSPQYVWTLFVPSFQKTTGAILSEVQWTITFLIVLQTWLSPLQGFLVEKLGPKILIGLGALMSGAGWIASSTIATLWGLYATYGLLCGVGTGIVYIGIIGLMVRWFPHRRGFATGVVAAGYGFGAILTTFPIDDMLKASGYQRTLVVFGAIFAAIGLVGALMLRSPKEGEVAAPPARPGAVATEGATPREMLKTPTFWLLFIMMSMMSTGGLMVITQFTSFARSFGIDAKTTVVILGMTLAAIPAALTFDRITNGLTRPFFGWVSDHIGRENTMGIAFILEGAAIFLMLQYRTDPFLLIVLSGLVFFGWGEIFSLFPSTLTDTFGSTYATTNYGFLYMAQGVGSILGAPVAAMIYEGTGSWMPVFGLVIAMDILTGLLALFVLKPMRGRLMARAAASGG
ncbi:MAG: oxalate/formate MFS antiporter [Proteobacteria bacterium]|nr:oxalate/formate MFS antiporter [Pseudomonadota bacterium]MBI3498613.1 oxalate/formate MFS antiporter [Pseudomonadota bacterium]